MTFDSVTRTLAVNACRLVEASSNDSIATAFADIDTKLNAKRLQSLLLDITRLLKAQVLGYSSTSYHPQGASAAVLIGQGESALVHLDKSHLAVHTYFEMDELSPWGSFRCELELSTCGELPVEQLLRRVSREFEVELFFLDCRVRGITRDDAGRMKQAAYPLDFGDNRLGLAGYSLICNEDSGSGVHAVLMADEMDQATRSEWIRLLGVS